MARGLQHADAQDLSQQVLMAVASAIGTWEKRDESTRFRHWLSRVTKNAILNALTRRPKDQAIGGSSIEELLREVVNRDEATTLRERNPLRNNTLCAQNSSLASQGLTKFETHSVCFFTKRFEPLVNTSSANQISGRLTIQRQFQLELLSLDQYSCHPPANSVSGSTCFRLSNLAHQRHSHEDHSCNPHGCHQASRNCHGTIPTAKLFRQYHDEGRHNTGTSKHCDCTAEINWQNAAHGNEKD
jgi:hypothetical protein